MVRFAYMRCYLSVLTRVPTIARHQDDVEGAQTNLAHILASNMYQALLSVTQIHFAI